MLKILELSDILKKVEFTSFLIFRFGITCVWKELAGILIVLKAKILKNDVKELKLWENQPKKSAQHFSILVNIRQVLKQK